MPEKERSHCWNVKGVWGDSSCEGLPSSIHCYNCKVYEDAGKELFERDIPPDYFDEWASGIEHIRGSEVFNESSYFLFKCGGRLFALPMGAVGELATMRMIHKLPHRRDLAVKGIVNINGGLVLTIDILKLFSIAAENSEDKCIIVCSSGGDKFAFTAEAVKGIAAPDPKTLVDADSSDPWYVGKKFKANGESAVLIDYEIFAGSITRKHL